MKSATLRAVCLSCVVATPLWAQDNPKPEVDLKVMVLMNGFYTSGKTNNVDLPQVAVPASAGDSFPTDGLGATIRQSRVTAHAFLAGVAGGDFNAELDVDFWGGQQPSNGGRTFPLLRIRRAWVRLPRRAPSRRGRTSARSRTKPDARSTSTFSSARPRLERKG